MASIRDELRDIASKLGADLIDDSTTGLLNAIEQKIDADPQSGSSGMMIIHFSYDDNLHAPVCDYTYSEIKSAIENGTYVIAITSMGLTDFPFTLNNVVIIPSPPAPYESINAYGFGFDIGYPSLDSDESRTYGKLLWVTMFEDNHCELEITDIHDPDVSTDDGGGEEPIS